MTGSLLSQEGLHVRHDIINLHADVLLGAHRRDPVIIGFPIDMAISLLADVALERGDESILLFILDHIIQGIEHIGKCCLPLVCLSLECTGREALDMHPKWSPHHRNLHGYCDQIVSRSTKGMGGSHGPGRIRFEILFGHGAG